MQRELWERDCANCRAEIPGKSAWFEKFGLASHRCPNYLESEDWFCTAHICHPDSLHEFCGSFYVSVFLWGKYVLALDNKTFLCDRTRDSLFLATCATSFRIITLYFIMWVNKYSAKDSVCLVFARSQRSALFITPGQICSTEGNPENQAQCVFVFFFLIFSL